MYAFKLRAIICPAEIVMCNAEKINMTNWETVMTYGCVLSEINKRVFISINSYDIFPLTK